MMQNFELGSKVFSVFLGEGKLYDYIDGKIYFEVDNMIFEHDKQAWNLVLFPSKEAAQTILEFIFCNEQTTATFCIKKSKFK